jgi:acyl carrier protein
MTTGTWKTFTIAVARYLQIDPSEIKPQINIADDLGADELDLLHIISVVEHTFKINVPTKHAELFIGKVEDAVNCIDNLLKIKSTNLKAS